MRTPDTSPRSGLGLVKRHLAGRAPTLLNVAAALKEISERPRSIFDLSPYEEMAEMLLRCEGVRDALAP